MADLSASKSLGPLSFSKDGSQRGFRVVLNSACHDPSTKAIWVGASISFLDAQTLFAASHICPLEEFRVDLKSSILNTSNVYVYTPASSPKRKDAIGKLLPKNFTTCFANPCEVAVAVTGWRENALVINYINLDHLLTNRAPVLIDTGSEYSSRHILTRTTFTLAQRELYTVVLSVQRSPSGLGWTWTNVCSSACSSALPDAFGRDRFDRHTPLKRVQSLPSGLVFRDIYPRGLDLLHASLGNWHLNKRRGTGGQGPVDHVKHCRAEKKLWTWKTRAKEYSGLSHAVDASPP
ncbi:hypothetical protein OF83DRAFT_1173905 [Amylostereum chailletii]|nr:hypothetical protein OF83DRAFT_1173905 [Amylostereum chailletii]